MSYEKRIITIHAKGKTVITPFVQQTWGAPDAHWQQAYALIDSQALRYDDVVDTLADVHKEPCLPGGIAPGLQTPLLIDLRTCSKEQREALYSLFYWRDDIENRDQPAIMGARIVSKHPIETVAQQIADCLVIKDNDQRSLWRLWDPQVFAQLGWVLRPEQFSALLGGIIDQWQINWLGQCYSLDAHRLPQKPETVLAHLPNASQLAYFPYFHPTHQRIKKLLLAEEPNEAERFSYYAPKKPKRYASPYRFIFSWMCVHALQYASTHLHLINDEIGMYADCVLRFGNAFTRHNKLAPHWKNLIDRKLNFVAFLNLLSAQDRQALDRATPFYLDLYETTPLPVPTL